MNPLPPNDDELVSAYLDGEATPDEVVTVESRPELMQRVEQMRSISAQLGAPVAAPPAQKEAHISAALDAFDSLFATADLDSAATVESSPASLTVVPAALAETDPADSSPGVVSLEAARSRRRPRRFNTGVIAAAAAVMLLFVAAATLSFGRSNNSEDIATSASSAVEAAADSAEPAEASAGDAVAGNALRELDRAAPAAEGPEIASLQAAEPEAAADSAAAAEGMADEDAMDDEAMGDDALDQEESFAADEAGDEAADDAEDTAEPEAPFSYYYFGNFDNRASFKAALDDATVEDLLANSPDDPLLERFLPCQSEIPELTDIEPEQILAEAFLEDEGLIVAEVFVDGSDPDTTVVYVVDSTDCTVISVLERP